MAQKLKGKVAVVTGAGSGVGIGREVALAMAAEGAKLVVNDILIRENGSRGADEVVSIITKNKGLAIPNYDSVATMDGAINIIRTAIQNFGHIDILVNAAANWVCKPTVEHTEADWDAIMGVHLKGLFSCTQAAIKEMIKQDNGGRIINFISNAAFTSTLGPGAAIAYCTAKAGVAGFTNAISLELEKYGITVNAISPVALTNLFPDDRVVNGIKAVGPEFVTPIIVYLATDEAKMISGQFIFSSAGCIRVLGLPFQKPEAEVHKEGKWTVDELIEILPKMIKHRKRE
jgi:NAD(P)-dependent dehydrogenase (short-subunit alcohol dehydrogenase family)